MEARPHQADHRIQVGDGLCTRRVDVRAKSELETFDGRDNRREIMMLLVRLGSDRRRAAFLESLIPESRKGFAGCPMKVTKRCDPISAYFMLVGVCNELGVSVNKAAQKLDKIVSKR